MTKIEGAHALKLKPCPFCGYQSIDDEAICMAYHPDDEEDCPEEDRGELVFNGVCCPSCAVFLSAPTEDASPEEGIAAWNRRALPEPDHGAGTSFDLSQEVARLDGILDYLKQSSPPRLFPQLAVCCLALVRDRLQAASTPQNDTKACSAAAPCIDVAGEIARVVRSVNEWDDRTSPDDYPEHLLITSEELTLILRNFAADLTAIS